MSFHLRVHRLVNDSFIWLISSNSKILSRRANISIFCERFLSKFSTRNFQKLILPENYSLIHRTYDPLGTYFMTHRISKIHLEIQTLGSLKWGWSIIRFWTYRWARISSELFLLVMWLSHKLFCHNLPRDSHGMNKHVATNTHLSKYMFFDDSTNFDKNWNNFSN